LSTVTKLASGQAEVELIQGSRAGNLDAFGELLRRFQGRVYTFCLRMVGDPAIAEDIAHGVFIEAYTDAADLEAPLESWLLRMALEPCLAPPASAQDADDMDQEPDTETEEEVQVQQLQAGLNTLPPSFRATLILRDILELEYIQVADIMQLPLGTAKSRVHRGRLDLAAAITALTPSKKGKR